METLIKAIKTHSNMEADQIMEAGEYGADAGWPGFTYTTDGADFYRANTEVIDLMLQEDADSYGYPNVAAFIASFNRADMADTDESLACLKSWYALEEAGRWIETNGDI